MLQVAGELCFKWWMRMREAGHYASEVGHCASSGGYERWDLCEQMNSKVGFACSTVLVYCNQLILLKNILLCT